MQELEGIQVLQQVNFFHKIYYQKEQVMVYNLDKPF
jgi:hypothetical protein